MSDGNAQKIGPLLKMERRKAGISQAEVALKSGITQATVSRLESGDSNFRSGHPLGLFTKPLSPVGSGHSPTRFPTSFSLNRR